MTTGDVLGLIYGGCGVLMLAVYLASPRVQRRCDRQPRAVGEELMTVLCFWPVPLALLITEPLWRGRWRRLRRARRARLQRDAEAGAAGHRAAP